MTASKEHNFQLFCIIKFSFNEILRLNYFIKIEK